MRLAPGSSEQTSRMQVRMSVWIVVGLRKRRNDGGASASLLAAVGRWHSVGNRKTVPNPLPESESLFHLLCRRSPSASYSTEKKLSNGVTGTLAAIRATHRP